MHATIRKAEFTEARPFLVDAMRFDTTAGACTIEELCAGSECFLLENETGPVGGYALKVVGPVVWLMAAGGNLRGIDLTSAIVPAIERQAEGSDQVAITTKRRGLVKKLLRQGYQITGITLRKKLK